MNFRVHVFICIMLFAATYGFRASTRDEIILLSPRQRHSEIKNSCMVPTETRNTSCCVCPGSCNWTFPKNVERTYSFGLTTLRLFFNTSGQGDRNLNIHLYMCARNSTGDIVLPECLLRNPLRIINSTKIDSILSLVVKMPPNLKCRHCLIQWVITKDDQPRTNPFSKQYFGCSDIAILGPNDIESPIGGAVDVSSGAGDSETSAVPTSVGQTLPAFQTSHGQTTRLSTTSFNCWAVGLYAKVPGMKEWCYTNCRAGYCPATHCQCSSMPTTTAARTTTTTPTTTTAPITTAAPTTPKLVCRAVGIYAKVNGMNKWCQVNCIVGYCPKTHCECSSESHNVKTSLFTKKSETTTKKQLFCWPVGIWAAKPSMYQWCATNCRPNYCPAHYCMCSSSTLISTTPYPIKTAPTSSVSTTLPQRPSISARLTTNTRLVCRATGIWVTVAGMHEWCRINCQLNHCPASRCRCSPHLLTIFPSHKTTPPGPF